MRYDAAIFRSFLPRYQAWGSTQGRLGGTRTTFSCGVVAHRSHEDSKIQACREGKKERGGSQVEGLGGSSEQQTSATPVSFLVFFYGFQTQLSATEIWPMKLDKPVHIPEFCRNRPF